jgi:hypothetical protein
LPRARFRTVKIFRKPFYALAQDFVFRFLSSVTVTLNASTLFEFGLVIVLVGQRIDDAVIRFLSEDNN